jgi:hypothetical protein
MFNHVVVELTVAQEPPIQPVHGTVLSENSTKWTQYDDKDGN